MSGGAVAVFRADAGPQIGAGHIARCLTLAAELKRWGWGVAFATNEDALATVPALQRAGFRLIPLLGEADEAAAIRAAVGSARLLVVDHYRRDMAFESACRPFVEQIAVFDDLADRLHDCDILVDTTADRNRQAYLPLTPPDSSLLMGGEYVFINEAFRAARRASVARRAAAGPIDRVLVSLGATDPANATTKVIAALAECGLTGAVDVVLGPAAPFLDSVRGQVLRLPNANFHVNPANIADLVARADFAIGASGTSAWERITLGVPSLLLVTAANQRASAQAFKRLGVAEVIEDETPSLVGRLSALLGRPDYLWELGQRAAALCDGQGVHRVLCSLAGPVSLPSGGRATLRAAALTDSDNLFAWRSDPETVRHSLTPSAPTREEHDRWITARLARLADPFAVVLVDGESAGVVRLEPRGVNWEVSITIAPSHRGSGVGKAALLLLRRLCPAATIYATIRPENAASRRIFAAVGYEPTEQPTLLVSAPTAV